MRMIPISIGNKQSKSISKGGNWRDYADHGMRLGFTQRIPIFLNYLSDNNSLRTPFHVIIICLNLHCSK